jgi:diguanylate cyclase (GGDEF)-like protein
LTGLLNRRGFFEALESLGRDRDQRADLTLAFLDLDRFKGLNDGMGHEVGDSLLAALGAAILKADQETLAARVGGDEFVLLLPRGSTLAAKRRLAALRKTLNAICARFSRDVTVSMGAARFAKALPQPDMALRIIDALMYAAKQAGKDKLYFADLEPKDWERLLRQPNQGRIRSRLHAAAEEVDLDALDTEAGRKIRA